MTDNERIAALLEEAILILRGTEVASEPETKDASFAFAEYGRFYDHFRAPGKILGPKISEQEFLGCDSIIRACAVAKWPLSYTAYALGTAYHETAAEMQPIKERGGAAYHKRMYDIQGARPKMARDHGNTTPGDGVRYPGRGYVQLTWKVNYERATAKLRALGVHADLVTEPDRAMEPEIAALVMVHGMAEGWFTGRKLSDTLPASGAASLGQFKKSRSIINGTDKDDEIAEFAFEFQLGLHRGGYRL